MQTFRKLLWHDGESVQNGFLGIVLQTNRMPLKIQDWREFYVNL